jgi:flagellar biosynthesis/type III secretory pathway protein FliH
MWQNGYDKGYETGYNQGRESRIAEAIAGLKAEMPKTFGKSLE